MDYETKFKLDQQIVYPSQGVGKVTEIFEKTFKEQTLLYYKIYLEVSDMIVMVPVDRAEELGIRSIVSAEEAQKAIELLGDNFEPITSDWKLRYQMNLDLLKKGSINDIATIVRCLYNRSKIKELPILERKLYDNARKLLEDEISLAMGISTKEAESLIHEKLDPPGAVHEQKHTLDDLDEDDEEFDDETDSQADDDVDDDDDVGDKADSDSSDEDDDDDDDFDE
ncbi:MAG: CarD family transcriptional regulator [Treponema sp.]|nr:CarD family transcriptional regulator [Treponema sp.]